MDDERVRKIKFIYQRTKEIGKQISEERERSYQYNESSEEDIPDDIENIDNNYLPDHVRDIFNDKQERINSDDEGLKYEDLKQSILEKESQLLRVRSNNENLLREYKDAKEEIQNCHEQIARQATIIHEQSYKLEEAFRRIEDLSQNNSHLVQKSKLNTTSYQNEIEQKDEELIKVREQLNFRDEKIKVLYDALEQQKERTEELIKENKYKEDENTRLKHKCDQHEAKIDEFMMSRKSESTILLELDQLKQDKLRLIKLLQATKEYKEFSEFADDSGGNIRYLQEDMPTKKKRGTGSGLQGSSKTKVEEIDPEMEKNSWIPQETYTLAHDVRIQTSGEITPKLMNQLLLSLNKIWRIREKQTEQRLKSKYLTEIERLRREKSMKGQYDGVQAKKSLAKTRSLLKKSEDKLKEYSDKLKKAMNLPQGMNVIDEALMIVAGVQEEKREILEENELLKNRIDEIERLRRNNDYEKTKFMEGASWMAAKAIKEKQRYDERDNELYKEFDFRVRGHESDHMLAFKTIKWLREALEVSRLEFDEVLGMLQDSAQYNMDEAMRRVQKVFSDFEPNILSMSQNTTPAPKSFLSKSNS